MFTFYFYDKPVGIASINNCKLNVHGSGTWKNNRKYQDLEKKLTKITWL